MLRGRRGARMLAITSGGAIPEVADYRVVLEPGRHVHRHAERGLRDREQRRRRLSARQRVVAGAAGRQRRRARRGRARARRRRCRSGSARRRRAATSCRAPVSDLRADVESDCAALGRAGAADGRLEAEPIDWLVAANTGVIARRGRRTDRRAISPTAAPRSASCRRRTRSSSSASSTSRAACSSCCTRRSAAASTRRGALALRKRFCRQFNFELQAAATEDALLLSLGPQHSFPLADVFRYLHPATARDVLVQAFLDAPVFQTRWRWNTTISLAVPRSRGGKKVPPQLQRMLADDLMAAVFPDAAACLENIPGDREIPDHPLVNQTVRDCLEEAMDFDGLARVLDAHPRGEHPLRRARHAGAVGARARDPQRAAVRVPGRCAARGAADAGGARRGAPASRHGRRARRARRRRDRARARRGASRPARRRRTARRAADRRVPHPTATRGRSRLS